MKLIRNLKIRDKLLLLLLLLLTPLLYFVITGTLEVVKQRNQLSGFYKNLEEAEFISTLIHELQNERALSNGYIASKGSDFRKELLAQRQQTDQAKVKLENYLVENGREIASMGLFGGQSQIRNETDQFIQDSVKQESFYTDIRQGLMLRVNKMSGQMNDEDIRRRLMSHISLLSAKHNLGRIRALSNKILTNNQLSIQDYKVLGIYKVLYENNIQDFVADASPEMLEAYRKVTATENFREVISLLDRIDQNPQTNLASLDANAWYQKFTASIGGMRAAEISSIAAIKGMMAQKIDANDRLLLFYMFFVVLSLTLAILVAVFIIRFISDAVLI
jgi:hypothetical protein